VPQEGSWLESGAPRDLVIPVADSAVPDHLRATGALVATGVGSTDLHGSWQATGGSLAQGSGDD